MKTWKNLGIFAISAVSLGVVACGGSDGAPGAKGDPGAAGAAGATGPAGDATPKSVGVIVPNIGLLDRELDVTITTNGVDLTKAAPTVDLGAGATVSNIQVLSATTLYAHVKVDAAATTGARDVKVTEGSDTLTSTKGFKVAAPISVTAVAGSFAQGGLVDAVVDNLDTQHAFDAAGGLIGTFVLASEDALDPTGSGPSSVTATEAEGLFLVAPNTDANLTVDVANTSNGAITEVWASDPVPVAAKSPTAVTVGTPLTDQTTAAPFATNIYKFGGNAVQFLDVQATATGSTASPVPVLYGDSGKNVDNMGFGNAVFPVASGKSVWAVVTDASIGSGGAAAEYGYTFSVTSHTGTAFPEPATAHAGSGSAAAITPALPDASTGDGVIVVGSSTTGPEVDWYSLSLSQNDNLEISLICDYDCILDLTDSAGSTDELDNGQIESKDFSRLAYVVQTITPSGANTYKIQITSPDQTSHGNYMIGLSARFPERSLFVTRAPRSLREVAAFFISFDA